MKEKVEEIRTLFKEGKISEKALLKAEEALRVNDEKVKDIYILLTSVQFIIDHIDGTMIDKNWVKNELKYHLKGVVKEGLKLVDIPFRVSESNAKIEEQHFSGSLFAEQVFRVMMRLESLPEEERLKFNLANENLLSRFKLIDK